MIAPTVINLRAQRTEEQMQIESFKREDAMRREGLEDRRRNRFDSYSLAASVLTLGSSVAGLIDALPLAVGLLTCAVIAQWFQIRQVRP